MDLADLPAPHSWRNKLARCAWWLVYWLLFRPSPRPCIAWRRFLLRLFGARGGEFGIHRTARVWAPWNLEVGDRSMIDDEVDVYNVAPIRIGARTIVSRKAFLCAAGHDYTDPRMPLTPRRIEIGDDAWVCASAYLGPGVSIGSGTVVGAGSIVTGDLPEWQVCAGNPCKPVKPRTLRQAGPAPGERADQT
jgi:putative colanic acid biosynthesis acetyltransferase WcaF